MATLIDTVNLLINLWLLIIVHRQGVRKQLPWFASYVAWEVASGFFDLCFSLANREQYAALYWSFEAVEVALIVGSVRESFLRKFEGFTSIRGFRVSVSFVIGAVILYSAWKAVHAPPLHANRLGNFIAGAEFLFRCGIAGIAVLTTGIALSLEEHLDTREDAVVIGFGVTCLTFLLYVGSLSVFPKQYIFLFQYLTSVGYFLAAFWWIWVFSRPVRELSFKDLESLKTENSLR